jgi:hypothetical protein
MSSQHTDRINFDKIKNVIAAPDWLKERMENLKKLPPPTLEEVKTQMSASAAVTKKLYGI